MAEDDKYADYLIDRFRKLGTNTSRWALLFFIALFYTWLSSIYPRADYINDYITVTKKQSYFDSLSLKYRHKRKNFLHNSKDTLERYTSNLENNLYDTSFTQSKDRYNNLISILKQAKRVTKDPERLKKLLSLKEATKGKERKKIKDTIKSEYLPIDVLINMSERQKDLGKKQKDSLLNKIAISFNIPNLSTLNFGFRIGLIVWMTLSLTLLFYLFYTRLQMIGYLKNIYKTLQYKFRENTYSWHKTDIQTPIWFAPVKFSGGQEEMAYRALLGWKYPRLNNILGLIVILILVSFQAHVAWLSWHASVLPELKSAWFQVICLSLFILSFFIGSLWLKPIRFSFNFPIDEHFKFERREFLKASIAFSFFLLLIPSLGKSIPLMKGKFLHQKRKKKFNKKIKIKLTDGLYQNKSNHGIIIHYFSNGKSLSLKTVSESRKEKFLSKLKKIEIADILHNQNRNQFHIPYWPIILEKQAYIHALKNDYLTSVEILIFALGYSTERGQMYIRGIRNRNPVRTTDRDVVTPLQERLTSLLVVLILRAEKHLSHLEIQNMWSLINNRNRNKIPEQVLRINFIDSYRKDNDYIKKWVRPDKLNWHLPKSLYL